VSFLNPWLLLGTLGVGVPILIHLLNRYRFKETDWAAMQFLSRAARVRSRQIRLKDILLLFLRCMAVLLFTLALARPTVRPSGVSWLGGETRAGAVIALDGSYSMMHTPAMRTRFDAALECVERIASTLKPGDPVSLVLMGGRHRVLLRNVPHDAERFRAALRNVSALPERLNLDTCPGLLDELAREIKAVQREVYVVSDVQAVDWHRLSAEVREGFRELGRMARVFLVPVGQADADNLAVTDFHLVSGVLRQGTMARYAATLQNFGGRACDNVQVVCRLDGVAVDQNGAERIEPGRTATVSLFVPFNRTGTARLTAETGKDALDLDNVRRVVADVRERVSVLCVDGSPSTEPFRGAADFVVHALRATAAEIAGDSVVIRSIPWLALPTERFTDCDIVVLANVADVTQEQSGRLYDFVREGGGLVLFVGNNVKPAVWNSRMRAGQDALLPARLVQASDARFAERKGRPLDPVMADHPVCLPLRSLPADLLSEVRFRRVMEVRADAASRVLMRVAGAGDPVLIEKPIGRGKVLLFTSTADREWNDMVVNPAYPMMLQQLVTYLSAREYEGPLLVGDAMVVTVDGDQAGADVSFEDAAGHVELVPAIRKADRTAASLPRAETVGFYTVRHNMSRPPITLAVNPDTTESDVRGLDRDALRTAMKGLPVNVAVEGRRLLESIREARVGRELWRTLAIAALIFLVAESLLAGRLSRRTQAEAAAG
jgi:hypothetical protein